MSRCLPKCRSLKKALQFLVIPMGSMAVVCMGDGFPGVMPRSFLVVGAVVLLVASGVFAWRGHWRACSGAVVASVIALVPPAIALLGARAGGNGAPFISLAQMNVLEENDAFPEVIAAAKATGADVLCLQEVDSLWYTELSKGLASAYPWQVFGAGERNYGIALFSRVPYTTAEVIDLHGLPAIRASFHQGGRSLELFNVHLRSPECGADLRQRNLQWQMLAGMARESRVATCVAGDLNTVPWDVAFRQFERASDMGHGSQALVPTWPADIGIPLIPLDHVLVSPEVTVAGSDTFKIPGSDHRGRFSLIGTQ